MTPLFFSLSAMSPSKIAIVLAGPIIMNIRNGSGMKSRLFFFLLFRSL